MTIPAGTRLGLYEILAPLGSGGMGEVYKARDTKLQRDVALKVLTARIESDPDAIARFHREARAIAALNHPHIVTIYAVEEIDGRVFLAMELIDGGTLADLIPPDGLPLDAVMKYAIPLADALSAAHAQGITHRDLKPANVMVTKDGRVKVLDFGLAKLRGEMIEIDATMAAAPPLTGRGQIVGTVTYMSPEQAAGVAVDHRTDLFSLGVMLYELATGERPFKGESSVSVLAAILKDTPRPVTELRPHLPRDFARIVRRALAKDPEQRYQSAKDLRNDLQTLKDDLTSGDLSASMVATAAGKRPRAAWRSNIGLPIVVAIGASLAGVVASKTLTTKPPLQIIRFDVPPPRGRTIPRVADTFTYVAPSPDGSRIAFLAPPGGSREIWIKALDQPKAELVPGTRGAQSPFWSPDGRTIAFFADGALKKKSLDAGPPQTICAALLGYNGSWNASGTILFSQWGTRRLMRVSPDGGAPVVERSGPDEYHWPQFLPDGRHYLFGKLERENGLVPRAFVGALGSSDETIIAGVSSRTEYASGHLFFWRDGALLAQPFDVSALKLTGEARQIAEAVHGFSITGFAAFSASPSLLVYQAGTVSNRLAWFDRQGRELEPVGAPMEYLSARISPDGSSVALSARVPQLGTSDIWIHDLKRGITRHFTNDKGTENQPIWSSDGRTLLYAADRHGPPHLHARDVSGGDERQVIAPGSGPHVPTDVTPDGRSIIFSALNGETLNDIFITPLDGSGPPVPLVHSKARESGGKVSPDGRWLAYVSDESGRPEVYVRPLRDDRSRAQVSRAGGNNIRWRADGRELFYVEGAVRILSADVSASSTFEVGAPRLVFTAPGPMVDYDVQADGQRFLVALLDREAEAGTLSAILNWPALLRKN
jgi:serine/threonine protein kinase